MKINVHAGHTRQNGKSPGAGSSKTGIYESIEDRKIKDEVIKLLRKQGHDVRDCTDNDGIGMLDNLRRIVRECNKKKADLDVSIHLNSYDGSGHGTEVHIYSSGSKAKKYAERTVDDLADLGFKNRGVKISNFYVLRETISPAMLIEAFFCDSKTDADIYKKVTYKGIAEAIVKGITGKTVKPEPDKPAEGKTYAGKLPTETVGLSMGTKEGIKLWQKALNWFGPNVTVDGIFGSDTRAKTMACQRKLGVDPDGYVGPITKMAFMKYKK